MYIDFKRYLMKEALFCDTCLFVKITPLKRFKKKKHSDIEV